MTAESLSTPNPQPVLEDRPRIDIAAFMKSFRNATHFREYDEDLVVDKDPVDLKRVLPDGTVETYMDKMELERTKGRNESVSYGIGRIGKNRFVGVVFNWEFMAGSSGVVAGEKFVRAVHLATSAASRENLPMIVACASSGQRQQEAVPGLREMLRTVLACDQFKQRTNLPLILILVGNVWGGLTASAVPRADTVIGMAGTDFGFAGRGPIREFEGKEPPVGTQTVENIFTNNRSVDVIVNDQAELLHYLDKYLSLVISANKAPPKPRKYREISGIDFSHEGFHVPFRPDRVLRSHPRVEVPMLFKPNPDPKTTLDQYMNLKGDLRRPDTLYLLRHAFDGFVPLFSGRISGELVNGLPEGTRHLRYPSIVAALAYIDDPRFNKRLLRMVIGSQPIYHKLPNGKVVMDKMNAEPTAWDYKYEYKVIQYAERLKYQITTFVDLLGARPTIKDELDGQYEWISDCLEAQLNFPYFTSGYLIGIGGSGGHLALDFTADYAAMFSGAQEYVAEPGSATSIVYPRGHTDADVIRTAEGMKPTASFLLERELVDNVIWEPEGGAQNNPLAIALALREDIIRVEKEYGHLSPQEILQRRIHRIEDSHPIIMGHLSGKPVDFSRSRLGRFFHR